jgi:low affinity Fe/Cu permease
MDKFSSFLSRLFFIVAFILLVIAIINWVLNLFGWEFSWLPYQSGRILEFSAILMIFVTVLLLRQIRESVRAQKKID